jgi:hypothetical protein
MAMDEEKDDKRKFGQGVRFRAGIMDPLKADGKGLQIKAGIIVGRGPRSSSLFWGLLLVAIGVIVLLDQLGITKIHNIYAWWPVLMIFAGVVNLEDARNRAMGVILIIAGCLTLAHTLGYIHLRAAYLWPGMLIAVGLLILWASFSASKPYTLDTGNPMNAVCIFSGIERRITGKITGAGRYLAVFGGGKIDLRNAEMEGDSASLEVNAIFGGFEILVPPSWNVSDKGLGIFGGYVNSTNLAKSSEVPPEERKTLNVHGTAVFGGVEIKN